MPLEYEQKERQNRDFGIRLYVTHNADLPLTRKNIGKIGNDGNYVITVVDMGLQWIGHVKQMKNIRRTKSDYYKI